MARILSLIILIFSSLAHGQHNNTSIDTTIEVDGRQIRYQEDHPREVRLQRVEINGRTHTVRAYGTMYVSFLASMIATELAYCFATQLPTIHANAETPNCLDETQQMVLDPGMNLGIIAMTFTSLEFYRQGDKVLKRFLNRLLSRTNSNGTFATARTRKVLRISRTMLQHLGMGAGMIVQTSLASSWNAPKMRECFAEIKNGIRNSMSRENVNSTEELLEHPEAESIVSGAVDEQMNSHPCVEAKQYFFDSERGTTSEIAVTVMSLSVSSVISGLAVNMIRFVGLAVLGTNPVGLGMTGSLIIANAMIEMTDRILEPYMRAIYHAWNSRRLLKNAFADIVTPLDSYQEDNKLIRNYVEEICSIGGPQFTCYETRTRERFGFPLFSALKDYKYAIDYRREAKLNRFIENHGRWEAKVSSLLTVVSQFQGLMRKVFEVRETLSQPIANLDTNYNFYHPITLVERFDDSTPLDIPQGTSQFSTEQLRTIYQLLNDFRSQITLNYYDQNRMLRLLFEDFHLSLHERDQRKTFLTLWRLKNMVADMKVRSQIMSNSIQTGVDFSTSDFERIETTLTNLITSFTPETLHAFLILESGQLSLFDEIHSGDDQMDPQSMDSQAQLRRGVMMSSDPMLALLEVNKDDNLAFYENQDSILRNGLKYGIQANTVPSRILTQVLCGDFNETRYFHNEGKTDTLVLLNVLNDPGKINCNYRNSNYGIWDDSQRPDEITLFNPLNSEIRTFLTDEANHKFYSYDNQEYLGLLSILVDPNIPLKWQNFSEFNAYWQNEMSVGLLRYLLEVRQEYFKSLESYFHITTRCDNYDNRLLRSNCEIWRSRVNIAEPITDGEVDLRAESFRLLRGSDESYYSMVGVVESFAEEARTYAYISEKTFGDDSPLTQFLKEYIPQVNTMMNYLNISQRDFNFDLSEMSNDDVENLIRTDPAIEAIGNESFENFIRSYQNINGIISNAKNQWPSQNPGDMDEEQIAQLTEEQAHAIIAGEMILNLEQSLQYTVETLLEKYIGGDKITYLGSQ